MQRCILVPSFLAPLLSSPFLSNNYNTFPLTNLIPSLKNLKTLKITFLIIIDQLKLENVDLISSFSTFIIYLLKKKIKCKQIELKGGLKIINKTKQIFHTGPFHTPSSILLFLCHSPSPPPPTFRYKSVTTLVHSIALLIGQCEQFFPLFLSLKQKLSYYITEKRNIRPRITNTNLRTEIYRSSRRDVKVESISSKN